MHCISVKAAEENNCDCEANPQSLISVIVAESVKMNPDIQVLLDHMKKTANYRQQLCLEQPTATVLQSFPCLKLHLFVRICKFLLNHKKLLLFGIAELSS